MINNNISKQNQYSMSDSSTVKIPEETKDIKKEQLFAKDISDISDIPDISFLLEQLLESNKKLVQLVENQSTIIIQKNIGQEKFTETLSRFTETLSGYGGGGSGVSGKLGRFNNYYDRHFEIPVATANDPNDFDSPSYQVATIYQDIERYAKRIDVSNDGTDTLFAIISHGGRTNFSKEEPIYPGEVKTYYNIYEMRFRSPTITLPYRVTEYKIETSRDMTCATDSVTICGGSTAITQLVPIEKGVIHNTALPAIGADFFAANLIPTNTPTMFRINVSITVAGILSIAKTRGGVTVVEILNIVPGPVLLANGLYEFNFMVHSSDSINFRYSTTGGNMTLRVQEIDAGVS